MARTVSLTKLEIIKVTTRMFLEYGYSNTSPAMVCQELNISAGNLTYHFPTKQHILAVMIEMLDSFQWKEIQALADKDASTLAAFCYELVIMAQLCEESEIARDLYFSAYTSPMSLEIVRINDTIRAKNVFAEYCKDWTDEQFVLAENITSGIEYGALMTTSDSPALEVRLRVSLNAILDLYGVPENIKKESIDKAFSMDHKTVCIDFLNNFKDHVFKKTESFFDSEAIKFALRTSRKSPEQH